MTLRTRARGRAVMAPHDDGMKSLAAQSRLALVRPGLLQVLRICFSRRQCWMQGSLGLPAQQRTWGIAAISAGRCRRFGHRNLNRITMERIMTVKAWTREDSILPHPVGYDASSCFRSRFTSSYCSPIYPWRSLRPLVERTLTSALEENN